MAEAESSRTEELHARVQAICEDFSAEECVEALGRMLVATFVAHGADKADTIRMFNEVVKAERKLLEHYADTRWPR